MNLKAFAFFALTFASGAAAQASVDTQCSNWQTYQTHTVSATCTDSNGNSVQTSKDVDLCVYFKLDEYGRDSLFVGPQRPENDYREPPGLLRDECTACGIYNNGLVCRCDNGNEDHWSNPLALDTVFTLNADGTLGCVNPVHS